MAYNLFWGGIIVILPFYLRVWELSRIWGDMQFRQARNHFFALAVFASIFIFGVKKIPNKTLNIVSYWVGGLVIYAWLNQHSFYSAAVIEQTVCFTLGCVLFIQCLEHKLNKDIILNAIAISGGIQSVWLITNYFGFNPFAWWLDLKYILVNRDWGWEAILAHTQIVGSFNNQIFSGIHVAMALPALFRKKMVFISPLFIFAIWISGSATAFLACFCALFAYLLCKYVKDKWIYPTTGVGIGLSVACFFLFLRDVDFFDDQNRYQMWATVFEWLEPRDYLFGNGLGWFWDEYAARFPKSVFKWGQIHNEFLSYFLSFGLVGIIAAWFVLKPVILSKRKDPILYAGLAGLIGGSFGCFPMHLSPLALIGIFYLSLCMKSASRGK